MVRCVICQIKAGKGGLCPDGQNELYQVEQALSQ